jgi:thiosulfate/3-mercaptopyruvate sulfurtransferase
MRDTTHVKAQPISPQTRAANLIVTTEWLNQHLEDADLRVLDVRPIESYQEGHLPGAFQIDLADLTCTLKGVQGLLLPAERFAQEMGRLGVGRDSMVVIYDDSWGLVAARVLWSLIRYGHERVAVLNGGWDRWRHEEQPWTTETTLPQPTQFIARTVEEQFADRDWLLRHLHASDVVLLDTRSQGEFLQGHVPDAIRWDWVNAVPMDSWDTMRPAEELLAELNGAGVTPDKEIVTYCHSGVRAAHSYLVLRHLGYPRVRLYDGSWLDWSQSGG